MMNKEEFKLQWWIFQIGHLVHLSNSGGYSKSDTWSICIYPRHLQATGENGKHHNLMMFK